MSVSFIALVMAAAGCTASTPSPTGSCGTPTDEGIRVEWPAAEAAHRTPKRPPLLSALYVSYAGAQVLDLYTTSASLRQGGREVNPVVAPLSADLVAVSVLKAATTAGTIYFVDRLWRRHRVAAVILMAGLNGAVGGVAAHNARVARRARSNTGGVR